MTLLDAKPPEPPKKIGRYIVIAVALVVIGRRGLRRAAKSSRGAGRFRVSHRPGAGAIPPGLPALAAERHLLLRRLHARLGRSWGLRQGSEFQDSRIAVEREVSGDCRGHDQRRDAARGNIGRSQDERFGVLALLDSITRVFLSKDLSTAAFTCSKVIERMHSGCANL